MTTETRTKLIYPPGSNSKPKRGPDGLYHFTCEECFKDFKSKSAFAKTCSQLCRNIKNYEARNIKYKEERSFSKKFQHNAKALAEIYAKGIYEPHIDIFEMMNFNFDVTPEAVIIDEQQIRFFGNYGIIRIAGNKFKIIKRHGN